MAGATKTGMSMVLAGVAVALMGAAPIPPGPKVSAGSGYAATMHVDMQSKTDLKLPGGARTVPNDVHLQETVQVQVLAVSGGAAEKVQLTYAKVDAPGQAGAEERKVAGRTFVITRGRTAAGDPKVTEKGKPITGKLSRKVWDDVSDVMAPPKVLAFRKQVLAHPGKTFPVPPAIFPELAGSLESQRKLVSADLTLVKVEQGKATVRLSTHQQMSASSVTLNLKTTQTRELDTATGRALHTDYQSTLDGAGDLQTPIGAVPAKMHGTGTGAATYTWHAAAPTPAEAKPAASK